MRLEHVKGKTPYFNIDPAVQCDACGKWKNSFLAIKNEIDIRVYACSWKCFEIMRERYAKMKVL